MTDLTAIEAVPSAPATLLRMQRTVGNRAVSRIIEGGGASKVVFRLGVATAAEELRDAIEGLGTLRVAVR